MEKPAQIELCDIDSPHFEFIFWDICDPLVHYVSFDFGHKQTRETWKASDTIPIQEPILIDRSNDSIIGLSANSDASLAAETTAWLESQKFQSPMINSDQDLPQSINPACVELYPSYLQELSKPHFSTFSSEFLTTPHETFQPSNEVHSLSYNDMSPAEILASIPQYSPETIPMPISSFSLEDKLFPNENVITSDLHTPDSTLEQAGNDPPNDGLPEIKATADIPDTSESYSRNTELYNSEIDRNQFISSTPISNLPYTFSSEVSSDIISCSSYSDHSVEQGSTEAIHLQNSTPLPQPDSEAKDLTVDKEESLGYNCFCGGVDDDMMIACEADHGESELWFHYHCAGIDVVPDDVWYCNDCRITTEEQVRAKKRPQSSSKTSIERTESSVDQRKKALPWSNQEDLACIDAVKEAIIVKGRMGIEKLAPFVVEKLRTCGFERSPAAVKLQWNRRLRADSQLDERRFANPHKMRTSVMKRKQAFSDDNYKTKKRKISEVDEDQKSQKTEELGKRPATLSSASNGSSLRRNKVNASSDEHSYSQVMTPHGSKVKTVICQAGSSSQASICWDEKQFERNHKFIMESDQTFII